MSILMMTSARAKQRRGNQRSKPSPKLSLHHLLLLASSSNSHKPETIDLTVDSDDDEAPPVRKPRLPLPPRRKGPSSPSYAALAVRTDLNDIVASSGQVTSTPLKSKLPPTVCRPPASAVVKDEDDSSDVECITREQFDQEAVEKGKARASSDVPPMIGSAQEVKSEPVAQTISGEDSPMDDIQPSGTSASTLEESVANTAAAVY
ncbi:hypothetical protein BT96DRAFT_694554 [Gymnopus androsaceus JB14]|uniref:Uncharacterized protein n=1 Tax=Gymnopus androsaceus JB14 TaxID=1447944 RepID=A0A6A4HMR4_9AGAR|nr:hypothetical protein BT96DRAFT_694554 [Gymnopus androsaceus JB14]